MVNFSFSAPHQHFYIHYCLAQTLPSLYQPLPHETEILILDRFTTLLYDIMPVR